MIVSSVKSTDVELEGHTAGKSLKWMENRLRLRMHHCGALSVVCNRWNLTSPMVVYCEWPARYELNHCTIDDEAPYD